MGRLVLAASSSCGLGKGYINIFLISLDKQKLTNAFKLYRSKASLSSMRLRCPPMPDRTGLHRVEAVQALGPRPLFQNRASQELQQTRRRLEQCEEALVVKDAPEHADQAMEVFHARLTEVTRQWFSDFQTNGFDHESIRVLPDSWLDLAADQDPQFGDWLETVYIAWGSIVCQR